VDRACRQRQGGDRLAPNQGIHCGIVRGVSHAPGPRALQFNAVLGDGKGFSMKHRLFTTLAIVGALGACHGEPLAPSAARGLTLSLALSRTELQRGEPDTLTMTLTNTNDHSVSLSGGVCEPRPYVADSRGVTVVPPGGDWYCILVLIKRQLAAGEHVSRTFVWDTTLFAPGVYSAHTAFAAEGVELATQPLTVRLN